MLFTLSKLMLLSQSSLPVLVDVGDDGVGVREAVEHLLVVAPAAVHRVPEVGVVKPHSERVADHATVSITEPAHHTRVLVAVFRDRKTSATSRKLDCLSEQCHVPAGGSSVSGRRRFLSSCGCAFRSFSCWRSLMKLKKFLKSVKLW
jgi:hypothetical protein